MATNTYVALDTQTLSSAAATVTFSSIPSTYTDLVLVMNNTLSVGSASTFLQFNGDTATNYSDTYMAGYSTSSTGSGRDSTQARIRVSSFLSSSGSAGDRRATIISIQNYANTTTFKTLLSRDNQLTSEVGAAVGLWRSTSAINSITLFNGSSANFQTGSTFSLYGIAASGVSPAAKATGGAIYSDDTYYYHVFGSTGTFTPLSSLTADVLVVAGGGGGGYFEGGGGGAGGLLAHTSQSLTATGYTCTVGGGGAGGTSAANGSNSQFAALTASVGGGYGGAGGNAGNAGGSGGGGGGYSVSAAGGAATSGQGFAGGQGNNGGNGGGGGGAGAVGGAGTALGNGGAGSSSYNSWLTSTGIGQNVSGTYFIAGGGGGGSANSGGTAGLGGNGGGGAGAVSGSATSALSNTGGGGGANSVSGGGGGGAGGSGVVIVRYLKA